MLALNLCAECVLVLSWTISLRIVSNVSEGEELHPNADIDAYPILISA